MDEIRRDMLRPALRMLPGVEDDTAADALLERARKAGTLWQEGTLEQERNPDQHYFKALYLGMAEEASFHLGGFRETPEGVECCDPEETRRTTEFVWTIEFHRRYLTHLRIVQSAIILALYEAHHRGLIEGRQVGDYIDFGPTGADFTIYATHALNRSFLRYVVEQLSGTDKGSSSSTRRAQVPPFVPATLSIINAAPTMAAIRAMWALRLHWQHPVGEQPYFADKNGVTVYAQAADHFSPLALEADWQGVLSLDDSKVSTFLICLGKWMADTGGNPHGLTKTRVHVADILSFRGVKKHHAGGYRREQKEEVRDAILALNAIWVRSIAEVRNEQGKLERHAIDSRLLEVAIESTPDASGVPEPFSFKIAPGDWAQHFLGRRNRFVATLLREVLRYDPDKQRLPMRLGIYLASQWRNRAKDKNYEQPFLVKTLLAGACISLPTSNFQRFREQFEQALDWLEEDAVIAPWEYHVEHVELPMRKWFPLWLEWNVRVIPNGMAIARYAKIPGRRREAVSQTKQARKAAGLRKRPE